MTHSILPLIEHSPSASIPRVIDTALSILATVSGWENTSSLLVPGACLEARFPLMIGMDVLHGKTVIVGGGYDTGKSVIIKTGMVRLMNGPIHHSRTQPGWSCKYRRDSLHSTSLVLMCWSGIPGHKETLIVPTLNRMNQTAILRPERPPCIPKAKVEWRNRL